ncbi:MAG: winged helix-turn-helix transcriptional regulator [Chloroflexi bacterium]|nr:winged helix-turn-helix transcriptional regulator [Chloroflexota bacterium]
MPEHLPPQLLEHVAERFRVLGDATRLAILRTLLHEGELNVGELVERLGTTQANVSKHLRVLLSAGIVERRAVGTAAYYSITDPSVTQLCDIVCGRLRAQIEGQARLIGV